MSPVVHQLLTRFVDDEVISGIAVEDIEGLGEMRSVQREVIDQIESRGRQENRRAAALRMLRKGYDVEPPAPWPRMGDHS